MVSKLYGAPMALGELEGQLLKREQGLRDETVRVDELRFDAGDGRLKIGGEPFRLQGQALDQIAARLRVPANYLRRCPPDLLARNLNHWLDQLDRDEGDVLVRFEQREIRALLSGRYKPVSHLEVVQALLSTCPASSPVRWEMNATHLALQVLRPIPERTLLGGVSAQNSETGHCVVELNALVYRVVCTNGLILSGGEVTVKRRHTRDAGATLEELKMTIASAWPNAVRHADRLDSMRLIRVPVDTMFERLEKEYAINVGQSAAVRAAYQVEPGYTLFDVINAFTRAGNTPELTLEERTELQEVGGRILASAERGRLWN